GFSRDWSSDVCSSDLDDYPHSTSACVLEGTEVFEIPRDAVVRIAEERPALYARLVGGAAQTIADRLRGSTPVMTGPGATYVSGADRKSVVEGERGDRG